MIDPKTIELGGKTYIITKVPSVEMREVVAKYPISNIPKLGDYKVSEEIMLKLMAFVYVELAPGNNLSLSNKALINNHVNSWEILAKLEASMLEYNCTFLQDGRISTFLSDTAQKLPQWISKILTDSLARLSQNKKQPSES